MIYSLFSSPLLDRLFAVSKQKIKPSIRCSKYSFSFYHALFICYFVYIFEIQNFHNIFFFVNLPMLPFYNTFLTRWHFVIVFRVNWSWISVGTWRGCKKLLSNLYNRKSVVADVMCGWKIVFSKIKDRCGAVPKTELASLLPKTFERKQLNALFKRSIHSIARRYVRYFWSNNRISTGSIQSIEFSDQV